MNTTQVGIIGAGQLGRMLALSGYPLGLATTLLDPADDACGSQVAPLICAPYDDPHALKELADRTDVITFEFENVPAKALEVLSSAAHGTYPSRAALEVSQHRAKEKRLFAEHGLPTVEFELIESSQTSEREHQLLQAAERLGYPCIVKTCRLGYDGKGQVRMQSPQDVPSAASLPGELIVEQFCKFAKEVSLIGVRALSGETRFYRLIENLHRDGILRVSTPLVDHPESALEKSAQASMQAIMSSLSYVGVLTIEFFESNGSLIANEMAPRVHNSGHWTIDGSVTSQFENHMRAIAGLPLGSTEPRGYSRMFNLIGKLPPGEAVLQQEGAHLHSYGKEAKPGRKIGHVTVTSETSAGLSERAGKIAELLKRYEQQID